jgi:hypothetical protein
MHDWRGCRSQTGFCGDSGFTLILERKMREMAEAGVGQSKAIAMFMERVGRFDQIALLTDGEVRELFGEETGVTLVALDCFSQESRVCASCGGVCCSEIGCEVYSPLFKQCPIQATRPLLCRFHFCHRFDAVDKSLVIELRDVFLSCYTADTISSSTVAKSMSVPPFEMACPDLVANIRPLVEAVREGRINPQACAELIQEEADRYRSHHSASRT